MSKWCSIWPSDSWIAAWFQCSKFIQSLNRVSWLEGLIALAICCLSCAELGTEVWYKLHFTDLQKKKSSGSKMGDKVGQLVECISQCMNLESFHLKENTRSLKFKEDLHAAGKQHSMGIVELLIRCKCPASDINPFLWLVHSWSNMDLLHCWPEQRTRLLF